MKKRFKVSLLPRIIVAIALGILFGHFLPESIVRLFVTFNGLFSEFLNFAIPLIILALVAVAIADIGKGAGKMLFFVTVLAYVMTLISGFFSYGVSQTFFPSIIESTVALNTTDLAPDMTPYFRVAIPPLMDVMTALFLSFLLGLGMASIAGEQMKSVFYEFQQVVVLTIKSVIIPLLPLYIMGIFMNMTATGQVYRVLTVFAGIIAIIFVMHILILLFQYSIAGLVARKNPLVLLKNMMPAYFTALGTQSSAATIPVTLAQTKKNGVTPEIADFVIPLCATIHLSGSTLKIVACALALMLMKEIPYDFELMAGFICMLAIVMVAAPGVPGGAIMASLGILQSILGFDESAIALMIALYIAMDSFGTACNVTGDGALAVIVDTFKGKIKSASL